VAPPGTMMATRSPRRFVTKRVASMANGNDDQ
jgi:hypothetical protein